MLSPLNPFPEFLWLSFFAPLVLRLVLGMFFVWHGYMRQVKMKGILVKTYNSRFGESGTLVLTIQNIAEIVVGIMLVVGWYTQIAAIAGLVLAVILSIKGNRGDLCLHPRIVYIFVAAISISLLATGAGPFAFDIPL